MEEITNFENELQNMINTLKFRNRRNTFRTKLNNIGKKINRSTRVLIPTVKFLKNKLYYLSIYIYIYLSIKQ